MPTRRVGTGRNAEFSDVPVMKGVQESSSDALSSVEALLASLSIPVTVGNKVSYSAYSDFTKDGGTTARTVTLRVRRGLLSTDPLLKECRVRSQAIASSVFGPAVVLGIDTPVVPVTAYGLFAVSDAGTPAAVNKALTVEEVAP